MLNIFYQKKITFSRKCLSVILPLLLSGQRPERSTTADIRAEVITGISSYPSGPQPQAVRKRRVLFCGVALSETGMVKTFIACWVILMPILWLEKAGFCGAFFFPLCSCRCFCTGLFRGHVRIYEGKNKNYQQVICFNTRKFLHSYEPSQSTFISSPFRVFCQKFCEFFPVFNFFSCVCKSWKEYVEYAEVLRAATCAFPLPCFPLLLVNSFLLLSNSWHYIFLF